MVFNMGKMVTSLPLAKNAKTSYYNGTPLQSEPQFSGRSTAASSQPQLLQNLSDQPTIHAGHMGNVHVSLLSLVSLHNSPVHLHS